MVVLKRIFMKTFSLFLFSLLLLGCSSTSDMYLSQTPVEVTDENISDYWVQTNERFRFNLPIQRAIGKNEDGYVKLRFLIDSNGNTFNPEVVESTPAGMWDYAGVKALSKQHFVPAESNRSKVPVYLTQTIYFKG